MAREAGWTLTTHAGPEIGVASTKAFTAQIAALMALALATGRARGSLDEASEKAAVADLLAAPRLMSEALKQAQAVRAVAQKMAEARDVLFLGRGVSYALALEGALKLKEISYIHAAGHAAGEMKHGPIALVDEHVPVVVVAPRDQVFAKTLANAQEAAARGGKIIMLSDAQGLKEAGDMAWQHLEIPDAPALVQPLVAALPLQLLAYEVALMKGTDIDRPRNLAKSVTVE
jgi:glucosamine--fructose-6-phosphate aminotransferase (isomerizing)